MDNKPSKPISMYIYFTLILVAVIATMIYITASFRAESSQSATNNKSQSGSNEAQTTAKQAKPIWMKDPYIISFNEETGERCIQVPPKSKGSTNWIQIASGKWGGGKGRVHWDKPAGSPVVKIEFNRPGGTVIYYPDKDKKSDHHNPAEPVTQIRITSMDEEVGVEPFHIYYKND